MNKLFKTMAILYLIVGAVGLYVFTWCLFIQIGLSPNTLHMNIDGPALTLIIISLLMCIFFIWLSIKALVK